MAIASNLGLELATVSNFFMNARRRSMDKWGNQQETEQAAEQAMLPEQHQQPQIPMVSYYPEKSDLYVPTSAVSDVKAEPVQMF